MDILSIAFPNLMRISFRWHTIFCQQIQIYLPLFTLCTAVVCNMTHFSFTYFMLHFSFRNNVRWNFTKTKHNPDNSIFIKIHNCIFTMCRLLIIVWYSLLCKFYLKVFWVVIIELFYDLHQNFYIWVNWLYCCMISYC